MDYRDFLTDSRKQSEWFDQLQGLFVPSPIQVAVSGSFQASAVGGAVSGWIEDVVFAPSNRALSQGVDTPPWFIELENAWRLAAGVYACDVRVSWNSEVGGIRRCNLVGGVDGLGVGGLNWEQETMSHADANGTYDTALVGSRTLVSFADPDNDAESISIHVSAEGTTDPTALMECDAQIVVRKLV